MTEKVMQIKLYSVKVLLFLLFFTPIISFGQEESCKKIVLDVYENLEESFRPTADKIFYLKYLTRVLPAGTKDTIETETEVLGNKNKSILLSSQIEVYQEEGLSINIIPADKSIYLQDYDARLMKQDFINQIGFLQDSFFLYSEVKSCKWQIRNDEKVFFVQLELQKRGRQLFQASTINFFLDEKKQTLKEVSVEYLSNHKIKYLAIVFRTIDNNAKVDFFNSSLAQLIFDGNGRLKSKYVNYSIIDNRKPK